MCLFSYSYGGYASGESPQVAAQPVYGVSVQQVTSWFIHIAGLDMLLGIMAFTRMHWKVGLETKKRKEKIEHIQLFRNVLWQCWLGGK